MPDIVDIRETGEHALGRSTALVTLVEYADFESGDCRDAVPLLKSLLTEFGTNVRIVFRHFPQRSIHPHAELAAEAAEAAGSQGRFWAMHDILFANQDDLHAASLLRYAYSLGLNIDQFARELVRRTHRRRVLRDMASGWESNVRATPTFFFNGSKYEGYFSYDRFRRIVERLIRRDAEIWYSE